MYKAILCPMGHIILRVMYVWYIFCHFMSTDRQSYEHYSLKESIYISLCISPLLLSRYHNPWLPNGLCTNNSLFNNDTISILKMRIVVYISVYTEVGFQIHLYTYYKYTFTTSMLVLPGTRVVKYVYVIA